ncbi:hypothetical protein [Microbispora sp. NBRC 16548]|uniref:hypothetical protein n=1 Tax=Microbispora sp. NBRC 16548 TaxID=3030994 RepID=UPI0024A44681|nr:hypothetical protein [Microbispora sp. NBRC 16548]GLX04924.1 hypothetical protein Misp03_18510 [Microbispora sp. NBRC 16548]
MSRSRARDPRDTKVPAMGLSTRRLAMVALVFTAAGITIARVAPHQPREGLTALRNPGPGGGGGQMIRRGRSGGGQVIKGGRAGGGQAQSGAGRSNQNLTGVVSPTFVRGQAQQAITDQGGFEVQATFCGSQPNICWIGQNMPVRHGS